MLPSPPFFTAAFISFILVLALAILTWIRFTVVDFGITEVTSPSRVAFAHKGCLSWKLGHSEIAFGKRIERALHWLVW